MESQYVHTSMPAPLPFQTLVGRDAGVVVGEDECGDGPPVHLLGWPELSEATNEQPKTRRIWTPKSGSTAA